VGRRGEGKGRVAIRLGTECEGGGACTRRGAGVAGRRGGLAGGGWEEGIEVHKTTPPPKIICYPQGGEGRREAEEGASEREVFFSIWGKWVTRDYPYFSPRKKCSGEYRGARRRSILVPPCSQEERGWIQSKRGGDADRQMFKGKGEAQRKTQIEKDSQRRSCKLKGGKGRTARRRSLVTVRK